jgi:signal transduction histidine kinase/ligand-binding sensor domain-containing protein
MWFATESGVTRYDGYYFDRFTVKDGLPDNEVLNIFEDSSGRIWFLTLNGRLSFYHNGVIHNQSTDPWLQFGFDGMGIQNMFEDDLGNLWISHFGNRVVRFSKNGNQKIFDLPNYEPKGLGCVDCGNNSTLFLYNEDHSELFLYFNVFVLKYNKLTDNFEMLRENKGIMRSAFFYENKHTSIYINGEKELVLASGMHDSVITNVNDEAYWAMRDSRGDFYYALFDGNTWCVHHGVKKKLASFDGLNVNFLFEDSSNNLWICSRSGIYLYTDEARNIAFWNEPYGFDKAKILCMLMDKKGSCLAGMYDNYLYAINDTAVTKEKIWDETNDHVRIKRMMWCGDSLLLATRNGVFVRLPNGTVSKMNINVYSKDHRLGSVNDFTRDAFGMLWIATSVGLLRTNPLSNGGERKVDLTNWYLRTSSVYADSKNNLWFSNINGFHRLKIENNQQGPAQTYFNERILEIGETTDQLAVALSETGGLFLCNEMGIVSNIPIEACTKDMVVRENSIWVATNSGIYFFQLDKNGQVLVMDHFGFSDGLPSLEVTALEVYDDKIYAGTSGGIAILRMRHYYQQEQINLVYTRSVSGTWCCSPLEIDYLNNNITIDFSAVVQQQQEFVECRYRFDYEELWKPISGRRLELTQLPYGEHSIIIAARYADGQWVEAQPVVFRVLPPFWYRWWFIALVSIAFFALVWIVIYMASRRRFMKLEQQVAINQERTRIAADLHDDIGADLTRISLNAEILKQSIASPQQTTLANKIIAQSSDLRLKADQIIWALNPSYDNTFDLIANIKSYANVFLENTQVHFEINHLSSSNIRLSALQRRTIFIITKELINNTIKHAEASKISIVVEEQLNGQLWTYTDNGKGCSPEVFFGTLRNGVRNMQKRLGEVDGFLAFEPDEQFAFRVLIHMPLQPIIFAPDNKP